jgi:type IV pilus assembly protein PilW
LAIIKFIGNVRMKFKFYSVSAFGFTLIEMMIALCIALIVAGAIYSVYIVQLHEYTHQQLKLAAIQNLRCAMAILEQQIRMAGMDPEDSDQFGITDVRKYDLIDTQPNPNGCPGISFSRDINENGSFDGGKEIVSFRIRKDMTSDRVYLAWNMGSGRFPMAENITAIGFAFAIDLDRNGKSDVGPGEENTIWAVDTDNDNFLDANIDSNNDGRIDQEDDTNSDKQITGADGSPLDNPVSVIFIKAVRVWLLAETTNKMGNTAATRVFVVGDRLYESSKNGNQRIVIETIIEGRNL